MRRKHSRLLTALISLTRLLMGGRGHPSPVYASKPVTSWPIKPCPECADHVKVSAYDGQTDREGNPGYVFRCDCGHRFDAWSYRTPFSREKAIRKWNHHSATNATGVAIARVGLAAWAKSARSEESAIGKA